MLPPKRNMFHDDLKHAPAHNLQLCTGVTYRHVQIRPVSKQKLDICDKSAPRWTEAFTLGKKSPEA